MTAALDLRKMLEEVCLERDSQRRRAEVAEATVRHMLYQLRESLAHSGWPEFDGSWDALIAIVRQMQAPCSEPAPDASGGATRYQQWKRRTEARAKLEGPGKTWLNARKTAEMCGLSLQSLKERRRRGTAPPSVRIGEHTYLYEIEGIRSWMREHKR